MTLSLFALCLTVFTTDCNRAQEPTITHQHAKGPAPSATAVSSPARGTSPDSHAAARSAGPPAPSMEADADREIIMLKSTLDSMLAPAFQNSEVDGIRSMRERFASMLERYHDRRLVRYYVAYCDYNAALIVMQQEGADPEEFLDEAMSQLETAVEEDETFAEGWALLSSIYGLKASGGAFSGMKYGPKSMAAINRASSLDPRNPRVLMIDGMGKYYTPEMYGGSKARAIELLREATAAFGSRAPAPTVQPDWGHELAYAYLGMALAATDDIEGARKAYQQALVVKPDYGWVKHFLLPQLEARSAGK